MHYSTKRGLFTALRGSQICFFFKTRLLKTFFKGNLKILSTLYRRKPRVCVEETSHWSRNQTLKKSRSYFLISCIFDLFCVTTRSYLSSMIKKENTLTLNFKLVTIN